MTVGKINSSEPKWLQFCKFLSIPLCDGLCQPRDSSDPHRPYPSAWVLSGLGWVGADDPNRPESSGPQRTTLFSARSLQSPPPSLHFDVSPLPYKLGLRLPPLLPALWAPRQTGLGLGADQRKWPVSLPPASPGLPPAPAPG